MQDPRRGVPWYRREVRNAVPYRWFMILLVIARLVLGEFSHAMPQMSHAMGASDPHEQTLMSASCPDHVTAAPAGGDVSHLGTQLNLLSDSGEEKHCCTVGCDCPCAHFSAAVIGRETWSPSDVGIEAVSRLYTGRPGPSADGIFRPPAASILHV